MPDTPDVHYRILLDAYGLADADTVEITAGALRWLLANRDRDTRAVGDLLDAVPGDAGSALRGAANVAWVRFGDRLAALRVRDAAVVMGVAR